MHFDYDWSFLPFLCSFIEQSYTLNRVQLSCWWRCLQSYLVSQTDEPGAWIWIWPKPHTHMVILSGQASQCSVWLHFVLLVEQCGIWSSDPWLIQGRSGQEWEEKWRMVTNWEIWESGWVRSRSHCSCSSRVEGCGVSLKLLNCVDDGLSQAYQ